MSLTVLLDSGPLGMISNPGLNPENEACRDWMATLIRGGATVVIPEIADYEVRRELLRSRKDRGIARLDGLGRMIGIAPITRSTMLRAASYWASARQRGKPTANDSALDGDVILAAQAQELAVSGLHVVVATTNLRHLSRFAPAMHWRDIH